MNNTYNKENQADVLTAIIVFAEKKKPAKTTPSYALLFAALCFTSQFQELQLNENKYAYIASFGIY
jgi:hypothetical protein